MMKKLCLLSVFLLGASLALLAWAYLPMPVETRVREYSPEMMKLDLMAEDSAAVDESRRLSVSIPVSIRLGDEERLTLRFGPGDGLEGLGLLPDAYESHTVILEAQVSLNGAGVSPTGPVSQLLARGAPVTFEWRVRPVSGEQVTGSLFLRLRFSPKDGGESTERALAIIPINIQTRSLWNVDISALRWLGWILFVLWGVLFTPCWNFLIPGLWHSRK